MSPTHDNGNDAAYDTIPIQLMIVTTVYAAWVVPVPTTTN